MPLLNDKQDYGLWGNRNMTGQILILWLGIATFRPGSGAGRRSEGFCLLFGPQIEDHDRYFAIYGTRLSEDEQTSSLPNVLYT